MGGNTPVIVTDTADVDKAAEISASFGFFHSGQVCI